VSAWYAERGLPPILQLPEPSVWDDDLESLGWTAARRTTLRTVPTADLVAACGPVADGVTAELSADPSDELLALVEPSLDPDGLARILTAPAERVFVALRDGAGVLLAAGRASTTSSSKIANVSPVPERSARASVRKITTS
jgi:hypothetical protein